MIPRLVLGWILVVSCASCERKPPECAKIHDMKECERTKGCAVSSIWVMGLPDAQQLPEHHQYECIEKKP